MRNGTDFEVTGRSHAVPEDARQPFQDLLSLRGLTSIGKETDSLVVPFDPIALQDCAGLQNASFL